MTGMINLDLRPDTKTLRGFGFVALGGFGLLAMMASQEWLIFGFGLGAGRVPVAVGLGTIAALSGMFSLVHPRANLPIYVALTLASYPIGFALSHLVLVSLFYGVITPIGLLLRSLGQDPMNRRFLPGARTYWIDSEQSRPRESYFRRF